MSISAFQALATFLTVDRCMRILMLLNLSCAIIKATVVLMLLGVVQACGGGGSSSDQPIEVATGGDDALPGDDAPGPEEETFDSPLAEVIAPAENPVTEQKRVLGKILFWDEQLSSDNTVACGTCHIPAAGGADPRLATNPGPDGLFDTDDDVVGSMGIVSRNAQNVPITDDVFGDAVQVTSRGSPNILMSMYAQDMFWDGRARTEFTDPIRSDEIVAADNASLESQALVPILSGVEMAHEGRDWADVTSKLAAVVPLGVAARLPSDVVDALADNPTYPALVLAAFGDSEITPVRIGLAIATYERTLVPDRTPWDRFMTGDETAMTEQQIEGWNQFSENTVCDNCHVPPEFTDHEFYNIGLRPASEDIGRQEVTLLATDFGSFKTPTLRNVGLRRSQMHVGWITDTQDAADFYNANAATTRHTQCFSASGH